MTQHLDVFLGWLSGLMLGLWLMPIVMAEEPNVDRRAYIIRAVMFAAMAAWWASTSP
jgi:hypothetical protein